ncbi:uncharacterized protein TNCV_1966851 [Trichonephila clavipes]|nr:uncharacterized protein TNCV_1966851 [Trichonephila clavipes]
MTKTTPELASPLRDFRVMTMCRFLAPTNLTCISPSAHGSSVALGFEPTTLRRQPRGFELRTHRPQVHCLDVAAVAEWYRYRTVACFVTGSSPVPLKTRRIGQRCTLNLSRAETSSRWCGVVVRRGGASSGVVHVT